MILQFKQGDRTANYIYDISTRYLDKLKVLLNVNYENIIYEKCI